MRTFAFLFFMTTTLLTASAAEPFRQTLTSAERGLRLDSWQISARDLDPSSPARWSVRKQTLHGGKQEGVDLITVDNGKLSFQVVPTRGMSILKVELGRVRLGWDSPVREIVHPKLINLESRGGLGWLDGFNEWMVRCGLEFAGHPGKDKFINNVGDEAEMDLTLHGKIGNIPASEVEVAIDREPPYRIRVRGRVDERMFYGPKLELWTEISTEAESSQFRIVDTIKNHGAYDQEFQMIYHANYGPPLLGAGSRFAGAVQRVTPFNAHAAKDVQRFAEYGGPQKGFIEQVYCLRPLADPAGRTTLLLHNAAGDQGVSMNYLVEQLPYITLWKNLTALEEGYVIGLEPGTGFPRNRRLERAAGRVPKLGPGQTRQFVIDFAILASPPEVQQAKDDVARIQGSKKIEIDAQPEP
jgi:hypothetical protein